MFAMFASSFSQEANISIFVYLPSSAVRDSMTVTIAGNIPQFGLWNPSAVPLKKQNDSLWKFSEKFPLHSRLEFKITRGSWESEAIYEEGKIPGNIVIALESDTIIFLRPITWNDNVRLPKPKTEITGTVQYHIQMHGRNLRYAHDLIVWLPPSYETQKKKRYPVLYMHDGQNIFDPATAFIGNDWRVDEVADSLIRAKKIEEIIVVGVYNSPDRLPEYSDCDIGRAYGDFLVNVVKPFIDTTYRTKPDAKNCAVMGSSMGGLISLLLVWWHPDIFSMAASLSPSFWYDNQKILRDIREKEFPQKNIHLYVDCGGKEKELLSDFHKMVSLLQEKGFRKGKNFEYHLEKEGSHNEQSWAARVWRPLVFMFGK